MTLLLLLAGCLSAPEVPLRIQSVNGRTPRNLDNAPIVVSPGTDVQLAVAHNGGAKAEVWWAWAPPGWDFAPGADQGVWHVPEDFEGCATVAVLVLEPRRADPRSAEASVLLAAEDWTQWCQYRPPGNWTLTHWGEALDTGWL